MSDLQINFANFAAAQGTVSGKLRLIDETISDELTIDANSPDYTGRRSERGDCRRRGRFPMPVLRYVVGSGSALEAESYESRDALALLAPRPNDALERTGALTFTWQTLTQAALYRIEIETETG
jgi:hypothetical protein